MYHKMDGIWLWYRPAVTPWWLDYWSDMSWDCQKRIIQSIQLVEQVLAWNRKQNAWLHLSTIATCNRFICCLTFKYVFQVVLYLPAKEVEKGREWNAIMTLGKLNQTITTFNYLIKLQNYAQVAQLGFKSFARLLVSCFACHWKSNTTQQQQQNTYAMTHTHTIHTYTHTNSYIELHTSSHNTSSKDCSWSATGETEWVLIQLWVLYRKSLRDFSAINLAMSTLHAACCTCIDHLPLCIDARQIVTDLTSFVLQISLNVLQVIERLINLLRPGIPLQFQCCQMVKYLIL